MRALNPIPTIPSLMTELMKGLQHEDDERLCAFIEVVKIPENIHEARIGSKPQLGRSGKSPNQRLGQKC